MLLPSIIRIVVASVIATGIRLISLGIPIGLGICICWRSSSTTSKSLEAEENTRNDVDDVERVEESDDEVSLLAFTVLAFGRVALKVLSRVRLRRISENEHD